jgi:hypothetical protein
MLSAGFEAGDRISPPLSRWTIDAPNELVRKNTEGTNNPLFLREVLCALRVSAFRSCQSNEILMRRPWTVSADSSYRDYNPEGHFAVAMRAPGSDDPADFRHFHPHPS